MEVVGRHALFFDDDANANFVNSKEALVEWNSLFIDRYDVRHLLSSPPASFKRLRPTSGLSPHPDAHLEPELDAERYADLPSPTSSDQEPSEMEADEGTINGGGFHAVSFSYGNTADSNGQRNDDNNSDGDGFCPPFPVPENLAHGLPSSEKVHQIIARTALFVSQHGGQSEIVLRVKQGDNPTFGFLMPHHHLHPYFRYLVDHPELLSSSGDGNPQKGHDTDNQSGSPGTGGALSLLGSVYGSVEDEDEDAEESKFGNDMDSAETTTAGDLTSRHQPKKQNNVSQRDESSKLLHPLKDKASTLSKSGSSSTVKSKSANNGKKKDALCSSSADVNDSKLSARSSTSNGELLVIEPPSELKRLVDRIVEIILKNGQGFEALLIEQDKNHGRFPFLLSSNQYHPYYKKILRLAQSRAIAKSFGSGKDAENKTGETQQSEESSVQDIPFDYDRKEKFKMVIAKTKKDIQEQQPSKEPEQPPVEISADAAAAILQAATRGIKKPNLDIISKISRSGSLGSQPSSQPKDIAKTAAMAAAGEADSSEAGLTKEQKLKAERLKRAKMFAAMIKSRGLSAEPPRIQEVKDREGSSAPADVGTSRKIEDSEKCSDNELDEKALTNKRHYRSKRREEKEDDEESDRHSRKKHQSHHSSHHHRRRRSSSKESRRPSSKESRRHRHKQERDSEDEDDKHRHHHHKHRHDSSSEDEYKRSRHKRRSSEKDAHGDDRRKKHKKRSNSKEGDFEEGEIRAKSVDQCFTSVVDDGIKEKCLDRLNSTTQRDERASSEQPQTTVVSDDLRAKIRAMLLATL